MQIDVVVWLPRRDEHELARSLGLVQHDPTTMQQLLDALRGDLSAQGKTLRVGRWHVWRVVREMHAQQVLNDPAGRAAAFAFLAGRDD